MCVSNRKVFATIFQGQSCYAAGHTADTLRKQRPIADPEKTQYGEWEKKSLFMLLDFKSSLNSLNLVLRMFSKEKT
jgi:hypothetical protein